MNREERRRSRRDRDYVIIDIEINNPTTFPNASSPTYGIDSIFMYKPEYPRERLFTTNRNHPYKADEFKRLIDVIEFPSEMCMHSVVRDAMIGMDVYQYTEFDFPYLANRMSLLTHGGIHEGLYRAVNSVVELIELVKPVGGRESLSMRDIVKDECSNIPFEVKKLRYLNRLALAYIGMTEKQNLG